MTMNPYWLIRRAVKRLVIWVGLGSYLHEYCKVCGRRQPLVWQAPNDPGLSVIGRERGVLCPECFSRRAAAMGYWLMWSPDSEEAKTCVGEVIKWKAEDGDTSIVSIRVSDDDIRNGSVPYLRRQCRIMLARKEPS